MGGLKSLESLRKLANSLDGNAIAIDGCDCVLLPTRLRMIAGEIEREIAKRYMEQPFDSDGVLVKLGDRLKEHEDGHEFTVDGVKIWGNTYEWWAYEDYGVLAPAMRCTHVKPRALEDVLKELACDVRRERVENAPLAEHVYSEYADEIRELIGGSE